MNYNNIIQLQNRINKINQNISKIDDYKYDTSDLKYRSYNLQKELNDIIGEKNNYSKYTFASETANITEEAINKLFLSVASLEKEIDKLNKYFSIFKDINIIKNELNDNIADFKLKQIIYIIKSDLEYFENIKKDGYTFEKEEDTYKIIYEVIKTEFRKENSSTLFDYVSNINYIKQYLKKFIAEDTIKYINEIDVNKRSNEFFSLTEIDRLLTYLISMNENNYKDEILDKVKSYKIKYNELIKEIEHLESLKNMNVKDKNIKKDKIKAAKDKIKDYILPAILSLSLLITSQNISNQVSNKYLRKSNVQTTVYDTMDDSITITNSFDYNVLIPAYKDDVIVTKYSDVTEDKTRYVSTYKYKNDGRNIEDYSTLHDNSHIVFNTIQDNTKNNDEEYTTVSITDVDYYNYIISNLKYLLSLVCLVLWALVDVLLADVTAPSNRTSSPFIIMLLADKDVRKNALNNIKESIKTIKEVEHLMNEKENGEIYDKEYYKKLKLNLKKLEKQYNEMIKDLEKYKELFNYNNIELKLK